MHPKLVDELRSSDGNVTAVESSAWSQVISPFDAQTITDAMQLAVEGPFGKAFAGGAKVPGRSNRRQERHGPAGR